MRRALLIVAALGVLVSLVVAQAANAAAISDSEELTRIGEFGTGAGQLVTPFGLASDPLTGHLFAVDNGSYRVSEFTPWGSFVKAFGFDVAPGAVNEQQEVRVRASEGQFKLSFEGSSTADLPFDASAAQVEAALGALPTIGAANLSVKSVPGTPNGTTPYIHVVAFKGSLAGTNVKELVAGNGTTPLGGPAPSLSVRTRAEGTPGSTGLESCTEESGCKQGDLGGEKGQFSDARGVAVDNAGNVYVREVANLRVQKFDAAGNFVLSIGGKVNKTTNANLCTAASGDECGPGAPGNGPGEFANSSSTEGVALCPPGPSGSLCGTSGAIFVADVGRIQRFSLDGAYESEQTIAGETVVGVAFDPVAKDLYAIFAGKGGVHKFVGGSDPAVEIPPPRKGSSLIATNAAGELFANSEGEVLEYDPAGNPLAPASCCAAAPGSSLNGLGTNGAGDLHVVNKAFIRVLGPPPIEFEGPPPVAPEISAQFASSVQRDGATVAALINPHFFTDAHYYVQYGIGECATGGCGETAPTPPGLLLTSKVTSAPLRSAGVFLGGLSPGTTYHYRFLAQSAGGSSVGPEASFTTPDPLAAGPSCPNDAFRGGPAARLPDCRAYEMVSPVDKNNGDIKTIGDLLSFSTKLSQSSEDGNGLTYSSSRSFGAPKGAPFTNQYLAHPRDPQAGWPSAAIDAAQGPGATIDAIGETVGNPYKAFSADLCVGWFVVAAEPLLDPGRDFTNYQNVYRRDFCGGRPDEALLPVKPNVSPKGFNLELQGTSAAGGAALVRVRDKLSADAASGFWQTYYASGGGLALLCILPDGSPNGGHCSAGSGSEKPSGLIGVELNRLASVTNAISEDGSWVYWTDSGPKIESGSGTVYLRRNPGNTSGEECSGAESACTVAVSETITPQASRFLMASPDGAKALFEVTEGGFDEELFLFEREASESTKIAGEVIGVAGASEDLSRVYFVSREALAPGASAGQPNLYLSEEGAKTFIATLSATDVSSVEAIPANTQLPPIYHAAQASPDGSALAFISTRSLSGYDNADLATGTPDSEVYLYKVGTGGAVCVSCNPSGARPQGRVVRMRPNTPGELATASSLPLPDNMLHTPRALSESGDRLFFESFDALLPRDLNGAKDVYEWERGGSRAACTQLGAELYVAPTGGCLSLISSGENPEDSEFADASASGDDVFFITNASLVPQDPGLFDVYDARVGGGLPFSPPPEECQGETCKPPATAPNDPTPASSSYNGPGNLKEKKHKKHKKKHHKKKHKKGKGKKGKHKKGAGKGRAKR